MLFRSQGDVPVRVVHDEGERQDTDKGGYERRECMQRTAGRVRGGGYGEMRVEEIVPP